MAYTEDCASRLHFSGPAAVVVGVAVAAGVAVVAVGVGVVGFEAVYSYAFLIFHLGDLDGRSHVDLVSCLYSDPSHGRHSVSSNRIAVCTFA